MEEQKRPDRERSDQGDISALNEELLAPVPQATDISAPPKRNTKAALIARVLEVAEQNDLELTVSNTQLRRMNKTDLHKLLGELVESGVKQRVAHTVGAKDTDDTSVGLATLRMVHDTLAMATEHGMNAVLPQWGYEVDGFTDSLNHPVTSKCVNDALLEIAQDTDVLQYVQSPYSRLAIAWAGAMAVSVRQKKQIQPNKYGRPTPPLGPRPAHQTQTLRGRPDRRAQAREELRADRSPG